MDCRKAATREKKNTFRNQQKETYQLRQEQFKKDVIQPLRAKMTQFIEGDLEGITAQTTENVSVRALCVCVDACQSIVCLR